MEFGNFRRHKEKLNFEKLIYSNNNNNMASQITLKDLQETIDKLKKDLKKDLTSNFKSEFDKHKHEMEKNFEKKIRVVTERVGEVELKVNSLERRIDVSEDIETRICNIIINGLPYKTGENLSRIKDILSSKLGFASPPDMSIYRFNGPNDEKRLIALKFPSDYHKTEFLFRYYKVAKTLTRDCFDGFTGDTSRIYLTNDLTTKQYQIDKLAMKLLKSGTISNKKVQRGIVYIKVTTDGRFHCFNCAEELELEVKQLKALATEARK